MTDIRTVVSDEVSTTRTVVTIGHVDLNVLGTFGWFIGVRHRHRDEAKDRRQFGTCVICRRELTDDEPIHMVFNVAHNDRTIGNRLCCDPCGLQHGTFNTGGRADA